MSAKQAYDMLMMDLQAQIGNAQKSKDEKSEAKAAALQGKADAEGDVEDTTSTRDADAKYLADLTATCQEKAEAFASRQQLRAEEIEAIEKAIEIISSASVSGAADKHLPALIQKSSFAQLRAQEGSDTQKAVAAFLQQQAAEEAEHKAWCDTELSTNEQTRKEMTEEAE